MNETPVVAIDGETYYDSDYSVSDASYWHYVNDERFDCYLVSVVGPDFEFVGHPKDFDWSRIDGMTWVSHNKPFEQAWFTRLCELGIINTLEGMHRERFPQPYYWGDTANLAVYLRAPRNLAGAVKMLLGITRSKEIRNTHMKGKSWHDFTPDMQQKVKDYALDDSRDCRNLWLQYADRWPEHERRVADLLAARCNGGLGLDRQSLEDDIRFMEKARFEVETRIPWSGDSPILSPKALRAECAKHGITPPASLAMNDEGCAAWEEKYGDQFSWVADMRSWRRANTIISKLKAMRDRIRDDGRMEYSVFYMGAHTGRDSGAGGFNTKNMPRTPFYISKDYHILHKKDELAAVAKHVREHKSLPTHVLRGVDFRSKIIPAPGKKFIIGDLEQIEARITRWLAGDRATLRLIDEGFNPYEAHAIRFMNFQGESMKKSDPAGYQLAKARELSLGFAVGWHKFITMAHMYVDDDYFARIFGGDPGKENREGFLQYLHHIRNPKMRTDYLKLWADATEFDRNTFVNSWMQVTDFRDKNPEIVKFWDRLRDDMVSSSGGNYEVGLPSGRTLTYFNVLATKTSLQARTERGGPLLFWHGGKICENCAQAVARDVFTEAQLRAEDAGLNVVLDVYDELVCEEPQSTSPDILLGIMQSRPDWAKTLPIGASVEESTHYTK